MAFMTREQLVAFGLTDEQVENVMKEHGKAMSEVEAQIPTDANLKDYAKLEGDNVFSGENTFYEFRRKNFMVNKVFFCKKKRHYTSRIKGIV